MRQLLVALCLLPSIMALPAKTMSAVCPALSFDQRLDATEAGDATFSFIPHGTYHFDFVNVIISLESLDGEVLKEKSYKMTLTSDGVFKKDLPNEGMMGMGEILQRKWPNIALKYSFVYCVMLPNGGNADCNTEGFIFEQARWSVGEFAPCPTECGLQASTVTRELLCTVIGTGLPTDSKKCPLPIPAHEKKCAATPECVSFAYKAASSTCSTECGLQAYSIETVNGCIGSDGKVAPIEACKDKPKPEPIFCPATAPCVTWKWVSVSTQCPSHCGYTGGSVLPEAICKGSDSMIDNSKCSNIPRPPPLACPATAPCITYSWSAEPVFCPTQCGYPGAMQLPQPKCVSSDGRVVESSACANMPIPPAVLCPATVMCVTVFWKPLDVHCPKDCGYEGGMEFPEAICLGSDGREHPEECNDLLRPGPVFCHATSACVTFDWLSQQVVCPSTCGFSGGQVIPRMTCMGTDGIQVADEKCTGPKPKSVTCPATFPCATFYWKATELKCPSACGLAATMVKPNIVCMDNTGSIQPNEACAHLSPLENVLCPATAACTEFHWAQVGKVECAKECGKAEVIYHPGELGFEIKCVGSDGAVYPAIKCENAPKLPSITCPQTEPCVVAVWKATPVKCPTECGLPASDIPVKPICTTTVNGISSTADGSACTELEVPPSIHCPATTPCLLPKYCPAISYDEKIERTGSVIHMSFTPTIPNVEKYHFEFIDLHVLLENARGQIMPTQSYRMSPTGMTWNYALPENIVTKLTTEQGRMAYWFTYCVGSYPNNIDCDTERKFYYLTI